MPERSESLLRDGTFRRMFEGTHLGMATFSIEGRLITANARLCALLGHPPQALAGCALRELIAAEDHERERERLTQLRAGELPGLTVSVDALTADGRRIPIRGHLSILAERKGVPAEILVIVEDLSDREALADQLARAHSLMAIATRTARLGGWDVDLASSRLSWSPEAYAIHGVPQGEQIELERAFAFYPPNVREQVQTLFDACSQQGTPFDLEVELVTRSGDRRIVRSIGEPVRDSGGRIVRVQGAVQDVTEQRAGEAARHALADRLVSTLESMSDAFFTVDKDWHFTYLNAEAARLLNRERSDLLGRRVWDAFPELIGTEVETRYRLAMGRGESIEVEHYYEPLDIWTHIRAHPAGDGLAVYFQDISATVRARRALEASEARFRIIAQATSDALWDRDLARGAVWWSEGVERLFGHRRAHLESDPDAWSGLIHPDDREAAVASMEAFVASDEAHWEYRYRFLRGDGTVATVVDRAHLVRNEAGQPLRLVGGMTDVTEYEAAQARLREQAALLDQASDAILARDTEHRITYWNRGAERLYGWRADEVMGRSVEILLYDDPGAFRAATERTMADGQWRGDLEQRTRDGDTLWVSCLWTRVDDESGRPRGIFAINTDVTERRKLEAQFLRAQRLESIGTLAGGIAHDLNNMLAPIMLSIDLLQMTVTDEDARDALDTIALSAARGADMVRQVLHFARGVDGERSRIRPGALIDDIRRIIRDTFPKSIHLVTDAHPETWDIQGDHTQLHQVLLNLCVNARDAMPEGGDLRITAGNENVDDAYDLLVGQSHPGPYVVITVADTGAGIDPEIREQIFDPFFTTKAVGSGTGLGLSTVVAIVRSHGGFVNVYSEPGAGTRFTVHLPATIPECDAATQTPEATLPRGQGERILVVDDEAAVRHIARQTLEAFGYRVLTADNGAEAVATYAKHAADIGLVLTDIAMPVLDGIATIRALRHMDPELPIVAASGLNAKNDLAQVSEIGIPHFLPKPFTAQTLLRTLERALAEQRGA